MSQNMLSILVAVVCTSLVLQARLEEPPERQTTLPVLFDRVRHIGLNDTHFVIMGPTKYTIINPVSLNRINSFTVNGEKYSAQWQNGEVSLQDTDLVSLETFKGEKDKFEALASDPSQLSPYDKFVEVEYPLDGSSAIVKYSQNYDIVETGSGNGTVMYYEPTAMSTSLVLAGCDRTFVLAHNRICLAYTSFVWITTNELVHMSMYERKLLNNLIKVVANNYLHLSSSHLEPKRLEKDPSSLISIIDQVATVLEKIRTVLGHLSNLGRDS